MWSRSYALDFCFVEPNQLTKHILLFTNEHQILFFFWREVSTSDCQQGASIETTHFRVNVLNDNFIGEEVGVDWVCLRNGESFLDHFYFVETRQPARQSHFQESVVEVKYFHGVILASFLTEQLHCQNAGVVAEAGANNFHVFFLNRGRGGGTDFIDDDSLFGGKGIRVEEIGVVSHALVSYCDK